MNGTDFIRDLAVVTLVAGAAGWLCRRLGLSVVVGYLFAGIIIGPFTPPFQLVTSIERVQMLAEFGLVFLIFSIGLGLSLGRLQRLGMSAALGTAISALLVLNLCRLLGAALGWPPVHGLFLAGMLMVSSSAIIAKVLEELNASHERWGQLALGVTVLEDVVAVVMLTLLTSMVKFGGEQAPSVWPTLGKLSAFVVFLLFLSVLVVPRLLKALTRDGSAELRTLLLVGLVLGLAWLATEVGYSLALGAFVLGAIVAGTRYKAEVESSFEALRQTFGAVFFVAIGMLFDFKLLAEAWPLVLAVSGLVLVGRPLACALGLMAVGNPNRQSIQAGLALTPIGEFSFVMAQLGVASGAVPKSFSAIAVGVSLITSLVAPVLMRRSGTIANWAERWEPRWLREGVAFYHGRLSQMSGRQSSSLVWQLTGKRFAQVALHLLFLSAMLLFWQPAYSALAAVLGDRLLVPQGLRVLFWVGFGTLMMGPLIALWRNLEAIVMILAEGATRGNPRRAILQPWLERALKLIVALLLAEWLVTLLPLSGANPWFVALVLASLVLVAALFWSRLLRWHSRVESELRTQLHSAANPAASAGVSLPLLDQPAGWNLAIDEVTLPRQSEHAGCRIGTLGLRSRTGCSIIGVDRQGFVVTNPSANELLYPGDRLLLLGSAEQLQQAERFLSAGMRSAEAGESFTELANETVVWPPVPLLAGRTLAELGLLRRFEILVCGIHRGAHRIVMPAGTEAVLAGDRLLVVGTLPHIREFNGWLEGETH
jgi:CPA2 family monovalent cation:H+ antiporter-2